MYVGSTAGDLLHDEENAASLLRADRMCCWGLSGSLKAVPGWRGHTYSIRVEVEFEKANVTSYHMKTSRFSRIAFNPLNLIH